MCKNFYIELIKGTTTDLSVNFFAQIRSVACLDDSRFKDVGN